MPRLRDLGFTPGNLPTGAYNAITDVPGVLVGQVTLIAGEGRLQPGSGPVRTGVTAILPHDGNLFQEKVVASVHTVNGFGKAVGFEQVRELGVIETPILLTNTLNVWRAADSLVTSLLRQNPGIGITTSTVNPVVGECNDGFLNDIQGRHVKPEHIQAAVERAQGGVVAEGNVGAGTGTACYQFKGGIGTASRRALDFTVGALVQTNFGQRRALRVLGAPVGRYLMDDMLPQPGPGSVMVVLATDAPLDARQLGRLARRAALGLARTGTISDNGSGDFVIAFSTSSRELHDSQPVVETAARFRETAINPLFAAVVESVEEAVYNALTAAETMTGRDGNTLHALPVDTLSRILAQHL
ncbi:MAG: P1 family peptidase [Anaerolineaceae bacterium]|nr:P1 family peptidase [Anaerolineaceae bacterium]